MEFVKPGNRKTSELNCNQQSDKLQSHPICNDPFHSKLVLIDINYEFLFIHFKKIYLLLPDLTFVYDCLTQIWTGLHKKI